MKAMISSPADLEIASNGRRLRIRDYFFIFLPLIVPYCLYRLDLSIINSLAYVLYYTYAALYVFKNIHRLNKEDIYFLLSVVLITFQLAIGNRFGLNSCLSLIAFVIVYKEVFNRLSLEKGLKILIFLYVINVCYMAMELISQKNGLPLLIDPLANPYSIIPGFSVGSSLYMHSSVPGLICIVALFGSAIGIFVTKIYKYKLLFLLSTILSLTLAIFDIRGTSLISFVLATLVVIMIRISRKGFLLFLFFILIATGLVIANYDAVINFLGYRFSDAKTGEFNEAMISMYFDVFFSLVILWYDSSLFNKISGQNISSISGKLVHGDFAFGNILYFEGAIAFLMYTTFIFYQVKRAVKNIYQLNSFDAAIVYINVFAIIVYFTSLAHYGNAINFGVANLLAIHIVVIIMIVQRTGKLQEPPGSSMQAC
jgi:hypothetical protein